MRRVLAFGDSNTHGTLPMATPFEIGRHPPGVPWPDVAAAALGPGWQIVAEGQPGRTTVHPDPVGGGSRSGLAVLPVLLESHRPLDAVVIMLGTNDCKRLVAPVAMAISAGLELLVDAVLRSGSGREGAAPPILLVAPVPIVETGCLAPIFEGGAAVSARLSETVAALAARRGTAFLDAGAVAEADPLDGVHLGAEAHGAIGRAVADALSSLVTET